MGFEDSDLYLYYCVILFGNWGENNGKGEGKNLFKKDKY